MKLLSKEELFMNKGLADHPIPIDNLQFKGSKVKQLLREYAKQEAIEFFKWNAASVKGYVDYIMRARESGSHAQLEKELNKFESGTLDQRYELYLQHKTNNQ
jgi:mannitol-1-phosphate/altronate dehydrogenase